MKHNARIIHSSACQQTILLPFKIIMMYSLNPQVVNNEALTAATAESSTIELDNTENAAINSLSYEYSYTPRSQFACLYTHHKTQKRKVWQDGRLVLQGSRAALHAAHIVPRSADPLLDQCDVSPSEASSIAAGRITDLEMDKFLVTIDGPWVPKNNSADSKRPSAPASASMQKLLTQKYRKPAPQIPPLRNEKLPTLSRKRPLQPGELHRKHYGDSSEISRRISGEGNDDRSSRGVPPPANLPPNSGNVHITPAAPNRPSTYSDRSVPTEANPFVSPQLPQLQMTEQRNHTATLPTRQLNDIADNRGYNPNSFYGEEEEEEDAVADNDTGPDLFQIPELQGCDDQFQLPHTLNESNHIQGPESSSESTFFRAPELNKEANPCKNPGSDGSARNLLLVPASKPSNNIRPPNSNTTDHHGSTLSTSQLLSLFGASEPSAMAENDARSQQVSFATDTNLSDKATPAFSNNKDGLFHEDEFHLPSDDSSSGDEED